MWVGEDALIDPNPEAKITGNNPFGGRAIRLYLREVSDYQVEVRGVSYEKKRKKPSPKQQ